MTALVVLVVGAAALLFGWRIALVVLVAGSLAAREIGPTGAWVAAGLSLAVLYVWVCWRWPEVDCWLCGGNTKKRPPGWLGTLGRAFRRGCLACGGSGSYTRFGRAMTDWLDGR